MALPASLRSSMTPTELEFIASEELVEIRPTVKLDKIRFVSVRVVFRLRQANVLKLEAHCRACMGRFLEADS